ncbi:MAG: nitrate- and nitrite sensing domain-containing protein [Emcibacter sp.]|nr:nitrate- and nitrite sensing domain-containing protein [Emcibacter sp.]
MKIRTRFFLLISIAVTGFLIAASVILMKDYKTAKNAENFHELANLMPLTGQLIHELQKERGTSAIFLGAMAEDQNISVLNHQKSDTNKALDNFFSQISLQRNKVYHENFKDIISSALDSINKLNTMRNRTSELAITPGEMSPYYTDTIRQLLTILSQVGSFSFDPYITRDFIAFKSFIEAKERAGQERAIGSTGFSSEQFSTIDLNSFLLLITEQNAFMEIFRENNSTASLHDANLVMSGPVIQEHLRLRQIALQSITTGSTEDITATYWFKVATDRINLMKQVEDNLLNKLVSHTQDAENSAMDRFFIILISTLFTTFIIISGSYIIARSIIRPLNDITTVMNEISKGDLDLNVPHENMLNSIGEMARALSFFKSKVIENIELEEQARDQQQKEEERKWLKLEIKRSERARVALKELKENAEVANLAKSEFLANMGHELRTPLNAIIGFSDIMRLKMLGNYKIDRYQEYATDINVSAIHLLDIINDILDLSNVETTNVRLTTNNISIGEMIRPVISILEPLIHDGEIDLQMDEISLDNIIVKVDERRFKKILLNLLSNAVKFSNHGGEITIEANTENGLSLTIHDNGIGMNPDDIPKAMTPFSQVDSALNRKYNGAGLGLSLANEFIKLHDGTLQIQSRLNVGTTATIWLPGSRVILEDEVMNRGA